MRALLRWYDRDAIVVRCCRDFSILRMVITDLHRARRVVFVHSKANHSPALTALHRPAGLTSHRSQPYLFRCGATGRLIVCCYSRSRLCDTDAKPAIDVKRYHRNQPPSLWSIRDACTVRRFKGLYGLGPGCCDQGESCGFVACQAGCHGWALPTRHALTVSNHELLFRELGSGCASRNCIDPLGDGLMARSLAEIIVLSLNDVVIPGAHVTSQFGMRKES